MNKSMFKVNSSFVSERISKIRFIENENCLENAVTAIANHPTQQHIILVGSEEGSVTVYDIRQPSFPASYLSAHDHASTELKFHPTQPDKLFTASANGELWKWTQT